MCVDSLKLVVVSVKSNLLLDSKTFKLFNMLNYTEKISPKITVLLSATYIALIMLSF